MRSRQPNPLTHPPSQRDETAPSPTWASVKFFSFFPASGHRPAIAVGPAETQFEIWGLKALDGLGLTRTKR